MTCKQVALLLAITTSLAWTEAEAQRGRRAPRQDPLAAKKWQVGHGRPKATIVFLHGLGSEPDAQLVNRLSRAFSERGESYKLVAPWLRPVRVTRAKEIVSAGPHTMSDQLQRARRVIRKERGPVVLMGHSFGGKAALQLAREFPRKVRCVVGLAPSVKMLYAYWKQLTGERGLPSTGVLQQRLTQHRRRLEQRLAEARQSGEAKEIRAVKAKLSYHATMQDLVRFHEPRVERDVRTPTLVLHGSNDRAVSIHYARRFADRERNPGVKLVELEGANHSFLKHSVALLTGKPVVDQRATDRLTQELAAHAAGFISKNIGENR